MPDAMERVQAEALALAEGAVAAHAARPRTEGLTVCERYGCDEAIAPARTALGARLCIDHQREHEAQIAQFSRRGHR